MTTARPVGADTIRPPNVAPAATQRSGRRGERRHSGGNELCRLRRSERSAAWADDVGADTIHPSNGAPAATRCCFRRGDLWSPACLRIHQPVGRDDLGAPSTCRGGPRERACAGAGLPGRGPHFFPKKWGERRAGGLRPPCPPQYGGPWRRWAVRTGQRPGLHCRKFFRKFRHRRCRAPGGTHRDYSASPVNGCAVPAWPAGPPSVPCRGKALVLAAAYRRKRESG